MCTEGGEGGGFFGGGCRGHGCLTKTRTDACHPRYFCQTPTQPYMVVLAQGGVKLDVSWHKNSFGQIAFLGWHLGGGMYSIFGKPLKRAIQTCMGHGGIGGRQKKLFSREHGQVRVVWPVFRNFEGSGQDFDPLWVISSGFQPRTPIIPWTWGKPRPGLDSAPSK